VTEPQGKKPSKKYAKTLRLTSGQLKQLDLKPGANTITFSLSASGVVACTARIFVWDHSDSIVVSDIDGTITKCVLVFLWCNDADSGLFPPSVRSDALGHVFTMIGRDWTHIGVAKLYTDICRNGYKIMYLTSRAIGQADSTRYYLKGIKQNDYQLPEGPVIMSPDRLMASLHR
jgi:phosphatidate phosphatase LPIN